MSLKCLHCGEDIKPDDVPARHGLQMHYECSIRSIVGSVAHQRRRCRCYGGYLEDDPALSVRANAKLACGEWHMHMSKEESENV